MCVGDGRCDVAGVETAVVRDEVRCVLWMGDVMSLVSRLRLYEMR